MLQEADSKPELKIVTIGGGTGHFACLNGLKRVINPELITAETNSTDSGGSSGELRVGYGVLPPGDGRQCILALAPDDIQKSLWDKFNFRFPEGTELGVKLAGQNLANITLAAYELMFGNQELAFQEFMRESGIPGRVIPISFNKNLQLRTHLTNGTILEHESELDTRAKKPGYDPEIKVKQIELNQPAYPNPSAINAIREADAIVVTPGDLYTSQLAPFLVNNIASEIRDSKAVKIYCANIATKQGETDNFMGEDFVREITKYVGFSCFDAMIFNSNSVPEEVEESYEKEGQPLVQTDLVKCRDVFREAIEHGVKVKMPEFQLYSMVDAEYALTRKLLRHDSDKLAEAILSNYTRISRGSDSQLSIVA